MKAQSLALSILTAVALIAAPLAAQQGGVVCADGTTSTAVGRGACSGHGGVKQATTKAERKAAKAERKEEKKAAKAAAEKNEVGAIAKCKDGTFSHAKSTKSACGKHGGIETVLKKG